MNDINIDLECAENLTVLQEPDEFINIQATTRFQTLSVSMLGDDFQKLHDEFCKIYGLQTYEELVETADNLRYKLEDLKDKYEAIKEAYEELKRR